MATTRIIGESLDDVMRDAVDAIAREGDPIRPSKGPCREIRGVAIELLNPRARLSRTEARGKPFSCLGELCWYLAGSNSLEYMRYYVKDYNSESKSEVVAAAYGPRLLDWRGVNQLKRVAEMLSAKPHSRQAVVQLFDADDLEASDGDVPCTCTLQFMLRNGKLLLFTHMRSNDVFLGLPHDFFAFTMIQELLARQLGVDLGPYVHFVGSLHLYERDLAEIDRFIGEGWQSTLLPMPDMPPGDPWSSVDALLRAERELREGGALHIDLRGLEPYWMDLVRLLRVHRYFKNRDCSAIERIRAEMSTRIYDTYINKKAAECLSIARRTSTPVG